MKTPLRILHLEDNTNDAELVRAMLEAEDIAYEVVRAESRDEFIAALEQGGFNLILSDYTLPSFDGMSALIIAQEKCPDVPFMFVSGTIGEETAIETLKSGATDYVLKHRLSRLAPAVHRALCEAKGRIERKRAEERLQLQSAALESAANAILITDREGHITWVNHAFKHLTGYTSEEVIGRNPSILKSGKQDQSFYENMWKVILSGQIWHGEVINRRKDGSLYVEEQTITPVRNGRGEINYFIAIKQDITQRRRAEERIKEQAALLDVATDAILVKDMEGNILFWNKGAERLYGWKAEEALGGRVRDFLYKEASPEFIEAMKIVKDKGEWRGELKKKTKDGREVVVESRWTLVLDSEGKPRSMMAVDTDITEKKRLEVQFLRTQRMESIGVLAGGIAHDLNNILSPIMMALEILRSKFEDEQSQKMLNTLEASAQRGADLVKQVLSFARGLDSERRVIQIKYLISDIQKILKETFPRSIEVITDIPRDLWLISADPTQLHQVLMNLCINARDAMPESGKLSISAENLFIDENYAKIHIDARVGHYIVITVSDTGVGIPPEIRDRMFEPFFTTKKLSRGTGLGLSTSYGIVKSHGGFIHVYSEVRKGTQFKVYLPSIEPSDTRGVKVGGIEKPPLGNGELILVVDDEGSIREIAKATLEAYGYRVITASDGAEAVALYTQNKEEIKLVIIDMMMPVMDGPTTIRTLRYINPQIQIIAVSGLAEKDKLIEVGKAEVQHTFIPKPYTAEVLLKTVQSFLTRRRG